MSLAQKILEWFDKQGRHDLPWQQEPTPYRVWVSEIMLQQTQVATVIPYYERFIKRFPNISTLAKASLDEVLQLWSGLGYYARARNLYKTAQIINSDYQGIFPLEYEKVLALPGIGRSTAGAILSISAKQRHPILDGNVKRILARHFLVDGWVGEPKTIQKLWELSEKLTPSKRVHHYTQAIMDLGATVCTRTKPACSLCPIAQSCQAKKTNGIPQYPGSRPKQEKPLKSTTLLMVIDPKKRVILLEKRPSKGIWASLWSLPECPVNTNVQTWCQKTFKLRSKVSKTWSSFRHTFTHFHLTIHPVVCHIQGPRSSKLNFLHYRWYEFKEIDTLGLPAPVKRLLEALRNE